MRVGGNQAPRSQVRAQPLGGIGQFGNSEFEGAGVGCLGNEECTELRNGCTAKRSGKHIQYIYASIYFL